MAFRFPVTHRPQKPSLKNVTADDLLARLEVGGNRALVDLLPPQSFRRRHIPGAINIPIGTFEKKAPQNLKDKNMEVIVYSARDAQNQIDRAVKTLEKMGYTKIRVVEGGLEGWQEAGHGYAKLYMH